MKGRSTNTDGGGRGRRASTVTVALAFATAMLGTTLPTPLYPAYEATFGFGGLTVTIVFATYAVGVICGLLLFGQASDALGRKRVLVPGLILSALSAVVFLLAPSLGHLGTAALIVGRALSGLSAGIYTGTATATLLDLAPQQLRRRAALLAALANILGLGLGPLLAGLLASWAPAPTRTVFVVDLVLVAAALAALAVIAEPHPPRGAVQWRPHAPRVPSRGRAEFLAAGVLGFAGFAVLGLFTAVAPLFLTQVIGDHAPWLTGVVVAAVFVSSAAGQVAAERTLARWAIPLASGGLAVGMAFIVAGLVAGSLALVVLAGLASGLSQGAGFKAALQSVTALAAEDERARVVSMFFTLLYLGIAFPIVGLGLLTQVWGLTAAGVAFAAAVSLIGVALFVVSLARPATFAGAPPNEPDRRPAHTT